MGLYATDGSINVSIVDGSTRTGLYATDGSWNVVKNDGSTWCGLYHPCGAFNVFRGSTPSCYWSTTGALNVSTTGTNGYNRITVVSGSFGPTTPGDYYPWIFA